MAEENKKQETEKKELVGTEIKEEKEKKRIEESIKTEEKVEEKTAEPAEKTKEKKKGIAKKFEAVVRGKDMGISTKHSIAICRFIKGKKIEKAIEGIEKVLAFKKAIPMSGEIPHRKNVYGKSKAGRYPIKACEVFIKLLKSLAANSQVNGLGEPYIFIAKADKASRPYKRARQRFKRTNVLLIAMEKANKEEKSKEKEEARK